MPPRRFSGDQQQRRDADALEGGERIRAPNHTIHRHPNLMERDLEAAAGVVDDGLLTARARIQLAALKQRKARSPHPADR